MYEVATVRCEAVFSPCGNYRFWLVKTWGVSGRFAVFLLKEPSLASAFWIDPASGICQNLTVRWGWRGFGIINLDPAVATRSPAVTTTDPALSQADAQAINDDWLRRAWNQADVFVVAPGQGTQRKLKKTLEALSPLSHRPTICSIKEPTNGYYPHPGYIWKHREEYPPKPHLLTEQERFAIGICLR